MRDRGVGRLSAHRYPCPMRDGRQRIGTAAFCSVDYYAVLGVPRTATEAELKRAYLSLARSHHPDKNPHRVEEATLCFKLIGEAYSVLRDKRCRAVYDRGTRAARGDEARSFSFEGAMDLFREVFGEELAAGIARVAEGVRPKMKAAAAPVASAIASAVDRCCKAEVVRDAMALGLGTVVSDAEEEVKEAEDFEERLRARCDGFRRSLLEHNATSGLALQMLSGSLDEAFDRLAWWSQIAAFLTVIMFAFVPLGVLGARQWATLICVDMASLAYATALWKHYSREWTVRDERRHSWQVEAHALETRLREAERGLANVQQWLANARGAAQQARQDVLEAERDGASLSTTWRLGLHLCGKLMRRVSPPEPRPSYGLE